MTKRNLNHTASIDLEYIIHNNIPSEVFSVDWCIRHQAEQNHDQH